MKLNKITKSFLALPLVFSLSACFLVEEAKTFETKGVSITLDSTFLELNRENRLSYYRSYKNDGIEIGIIDPELNVSASSLLNQIRNEEDIFLLDDTQVTPLFPMYPKRNDLMPNSYYEFYYKQEYNGNSEAKVYTLLCDINTEYNITVEAFMLYTEENKEYYTKKLFEWLNSIKIDVSKLTAN